jgi:hypothetical protein
MFDPVSTEAMVASGSPPNIFTFCPQNAEKILKRIDILCTLYGSRTKIKSRQQFDGKKGRFMNLPEVCWFGA